jgi:hypothetical protein
VAHPVTDRLRHDPAALHGDGEYWGLAWSALAWIEENVRPGMATLETGSGASTIVLAARGAVHEAITPAATEEERVRSVCAKLGIDSSQVTFHIGLSHEVLPRRAPRALDLVLIDGAHGFPYPILDWWLVASHVKVGGEVLLDDAYLPAVGAIVDYARRSPAWQLEEAVSFRTARIRKLADDQPPFDADALAAHGRMSFGYLPPARRVAASARQRIFSTRAGLWLVRALRDRRSS